MVLPVTNPTKSYWIEAAESKLRSHRSTEDLPKEADVIIVGSGYSGASAAYWIHKHTEGHATKPNIVLLEARDICGSATGRNGGQLRPHLYSRYLTWKERFGAQTALELIKHEWAHVDAFKVLAEEEGITEEVCLKFGETFDAAMTEEAWLRLKANFDSLKEDHGDEDEVVKLIRTIEDSSEAEEFTQMKGALAAVVHPAGQIWPYKFVHAILRIVLEKGNLNLQSHTPVLRTSERDSAGWITVETERGSIRARSVIHATNRWASHLLPEFQKLILPERSTLAAIKAPEGFIKRTGAQHWDARVNNYHLQLPPPYNTIILGGARQLLVHQPQACFPSDEEDKQFVGVTKFFQSWPSSDVKGWSGSELAELGKPADEGGCWSGIETSSIDSFPFVGPVPNREGHFISAGFVGHGMPRILLSTAHVVPLVLDFLGAEYSKPTLVEPYPALPTPFRATPERVESLQKTAAIPAKLEAYRKGCEESAKKPFCNDERSWPKVWSARG